MSEEMDICDGKRKFIGKGCLIALFIILMILSLTVFRPVLTNQTTYAEQAAYLNEKAANAKMLCLGSTSASLIVSMLPDDAGTPIANELANFSGYLLLVISAVFLEQYLLTTIGFVASTFIFPLGCICAICATIAASGTKVKWKEYAFRLLIFSICIVLVIPVGCMCGRAIELANADSIEMALNDARNANEMVESIPVEEGNKNIFDKVGDFFSGLWKSATEAYEWAKTVVNNFMSSIAVMLVTTIVIPILMFFCFIWLIRFLTKRDFVVAVVGFADRFVESTRRTLTGAGRALNKKAGEL